MSTKLLRIIINRLGFSSCRLCGRLPILLMLLKLRTGKLLSTCYRTENYREKSEDLDSTERTVAYNFITKRILFRATA